MIFERGINLKERIIAVLAISAIILSSCANQKEAPTETEVSAGTSVTTEESVTTISAETTMSETTVSVEETTEEAVETAASETSQTETVTSASETEVKNDDAPAEAALTGKWTEKNRLYSYEFDDSGNVAIDTSSCRISGKYELNGKYDLILYLDWQGEYEGDESMPYGFDLEKTDNGYKMNYHPMDEDGCMPFEPLTLVSGFASALWDDEPIVLTAYEELPIVQQQDLLGLWDVDGELILLFTDDAVYAAEDRGLYALDDTIVKDGTWDIDGETAYMSSDGEKVVLTTLYETKFFTKWDPEEAPLTGIFTVKADDEESAELWLKNGKGIVYDEASSSAASVRIDGADITVKMEDKTISGIFCPCRNGSIDPDKDKHGYYKNGKLPCSYFIMTDEGQASIEFDSFTLFSSRFYEWYKNC